MDLWILDSHPPLTRIGMIDTYQSLIWTRRYAELGDFELVVPATPENLTLLQQGNFVVRDKFKTVMRIDSIDIKTDVQNGDTIIAKGKDARSLLNQRINLYEAYNDNYKATDVIFNLFKWNCSLDAGDTRKFLYMSYRDETSSEVAYPSIVLYKQVFDYIKEICQQCGYGSDMVFGSYTFPDSEGNITFLIYEGVDRSLSQNVNMPVVFTEELDNLASSEYTESYDQYKNACYITGENTVAEVDLGEGIDRFELYVDGKGVQKGDLTSTQYEKALEQFGINALQGRQVVVTFTGQVIDNTHQYGVDYDLGDIVTIYNKLGMAYDARVTQVIENDDTQNGHIFIATFETRQATVFEKKAQAVLGANGTLYFTYGAPYAVGDFIKSTVVDAVYDVPTVVTGTGSIPWYDGSTYRSDITAVEFDSSFAQVQLTTLMYFFRDLRYVASFSGTQYLDLSQCTNMYYAFFRCGRNASSFNLDVSGWDVSKVTSFSHCFEYVGYSVSNGNWSLDGLGTWDVSSARTMNNMFAWAGYSLPVGTHLSWYGNMLANWNTANVTDMTSMFDNFCRTAAFNLNLSYWNVQAVGSNHNNFGRNVTSQIVQPHWVA